MRLLMSRARSKPSPPWTRHDEEREEERVDERRYEDRVSGEDDQDAVPDLERAPLLQAVVLRISGLSRVYVRTRS